MVRITEAIFKDGVLRLAEKLDLREDERVRVTIESIDQEQPHDRASALARVLKGQAETNFRSQGHYPTRDELHERR